MLCCRTVSSNHLQPVTSKPTNDQSPGLKTLSLPILEKGKVPNRVELCQLSARIKDKLKPTRDELLHKRSQEQRQLTTIVSLVYYSGNICNQVIDLKIEAQQREKFQIIALQCLNFILNIPVEK